MMQNNSKAPSGSWADDPALAPWRAQPAAAPRPAPPGEGPSGHTEGPRVQHEEQPIPEPARQRPPVEPPSPPPVPPAPAPPQAAAPAASSAVVTGPWSPLGPPVPVAHAEPAPPLAPPGRGPGRPEGSADALSYQQLVRSRRDRPKEGWRGAAYTLSRGRWNPGLSPAEADRRQKIVRVQAQLAGWHTITVASMKGGIGKTTVSALLGLVLAEYRGDRVVALDANPDAGTLADRVLGHPVLYTVRDLITNLHTIHSLTDITRYTSLAGRLQVLASEQDPAMSESFNRNEYEQVATVLKRFYNIIITDSGTGLIHSAMAGALEATRTLVIVGAPTVDGGSRASKTLDWLKAHGYDDLVSNAVVALSCDRFSRDIDRSAVIDHFAVRCRAVVEIPTDPHLATGGLIQLDHLRERTRDAALTLGAYVADQFSWNHAARTYDPDRTHHDRERG
ncbi:MinD/ParA family ATP-binding protein [Pseudonocardia acidicola]|uniref:MinD/ParA family protein n=1 Tax=Pseudonocardia acidicola TaxID=2724939 RepID=A0ABX1SGE2_9PSEU|nr:MinD/ParA family protein [Pseudonocardia acidicola]NMI00632.1 MinD/ParA family protein [Pseudonocardia acidicola]